MWHKIEGQLSAQLPFVAYRKPKQDEVSVIFQHDDFLNKVVDFSENGFIFASFDSKKQPVLIKNDASLRFRCVEKEKPSFLINSDTQHQTERDDFIDLVQKAMADIKSEKIKKVVVSRMFEVQNTTSPIVLFKRILATYKNALCYLWYHPKVGLWLGATPEILMQSNGEKLTTMSLAGTLKYEHDKKPDWGLKELEEQQLVTDYILKALAGKISDFEISETEAIRAGNLLHLRTKITGRIIENELAKIIRGLHPTPAICGLPKKEALDFILKNEGYDREFYAGFLGELNLEQDNSSTIYVNLRCMQAVADKVKIYVGGGVTQGSDPQKEWQETVNKSETMLRILTTQN